MERIARLPPAHPVHEALIQLRSILGSLPPQTVCEPLSHKNELWEMGAGPIV